MTDKNAPPPSEPDVRISRMMVVLVTCGNQEEAEKIAKSLVEKRLAACVNLTDVRSIYRWEGKVQDDHEHLLIIKTRIGGFAALRAEIERLHSYSVPEIIALPIVEVARPYLNWIEESVTPPEARGPDRP